MSWTLNRQRVSCLPCCSDDAPTMYDTPCALLNTRSAALQGIFVVLGQCASILGRYATLCRPYQGSGQETWTNRIYIITDVLLASTVSTEHSSDGSLEAGASPLAVAALAHGIPLPTHTPEASLKVSKVSKEGEQACDIM